MGHDRQDAGQDGLAFLAGGGEMGALIRRHDWAATPLGPPAGWPQGLRTALRVLLTTNHPIFIFWGLRHLCFYNDAYRRSIGPERHPGALGRPGREVWDEIWPIIGPQIEAVMAGRGATWHEDHLVPITRHGRREEVWWTYSYGPIDEADSPGGIGGVLVICSETTRKVISERRLGFRVALEDRLRAVAEPRGAMVAAAEMLGRHLGVARVAFGEVDAAGQSFTVEVDWAAGRAPGLAGRHRLADLGAPLVRCLAAGRTARIGGPPAPPVAFAAMEGALAVPLLKDGALTAVLFVHAERRGGWTEEEEALARDVVERIWAAVGRARAEAALRESEDHYRHTVELNPQVTWTAAPDGQLDHVASRWLDWTGTTGLGESWAAGLHADDRARTFAAWSRSVATGEPYDIEHRVKMRDGSYRWARSRAFPRRGEDGAIVKWYGATEDVHARRLAEEEARRYRALVEQAPDFIGMSDPEGRVLFINDGARRLVGAPDDGFDWSNARVLDFFLPEDRADVAAGILPALLAGRRWEGEHRFRHLGTGEPIPVWYDAFPILDTAGRVALLGTVTRDITAQKRAEAALRESEARFRHLADSAPALIWMTDAEGQVTFANMHHDYLFGRPAAAMRGEGWKQVVLPEDLGGFEAGFRAAFGARRGFRAELRVRDRHGEVRWLRCEGVPRLDDAHRFLGYTGCGVDITEAKVAEAELRRLAGTLEQRVAAEVAERARAEDALRQAQKMEAVGQLTGGVAHDFNNLLTVIRSSTALLRRPDLPEERRRRYVDAIADTVDRAARLTGQLLAFARRQALKPEVFDAAARVRAVTDMLRSIMGARVRIELDVATEGCVVEADASQFETALVNMAVNARDAMDGEGRLAVRVEVVPRMPAIRGHAGGPGAFVAVSLADTGAGIPAEELGRIFEPFYTTKEVGKGTGLGLSQVYGFAKQSGGDVAVRSEVGRGTSFTLYLPRADRAAAGPPATPSAEPGPSLPPGQAAAPRVLVVEDNAEVGAFSTQVLRDLGYETAWATNAREALACLGEGAMFDVVFSDVVMPGMSGVELGEEIRRRYPGLPVVLTSGYSHVLAEEGRHGFELLQKPYAVEDLSRALRRATGARGGVA